MTEPPGGAPAPDAVVFQPMGRRVPAAAGVNLLDLARAAGVDLAGPCGGRGLCGKCQVRLEPQEAPPPQAGERELLGQAVEQGYRLACQTSLDQGGAVWVPRKSRRGRQVILTQGAGAPVELDPAARCHDRPCLGLAVDLGTTTVVAYLADLTSGQTLATASAMNPQIALGEDVISRIARAGQSPAALAELSSLARGVVNGLAAQACRQAGAPLDKVLDCTLVGNTAMHHLFLGLDPAGLALAPYAPVTTTALDLPARQAGLELAAGATLHLPPVKAGFVGSDAVAAALALGAEDLRRPTLILDLGTNGEMILAAAGRMLCCSAAAGPAFEGGHIAAGMRAAAGAVEAVAIGPDLEPSLRIIGGGAPLGLCGSGVVSAVAELISAGALTPGGSFAPGLASPRLRPGPRGLEYVLAWASRSASGHDLAIAAQDVAEVQLAKAAVHAGVAIMMESLGLERVERVLLAGAFGNYLDPGAACAIGLFPGARPEIITAVGNAAGAGALSLLLNRWQRLRAQDLARRLSYLELAACPQFNERFVEGMPLPRPAA